MVEMDLAHMVDFENMGWGVFQNSTQDMYSHSHYGTTNAHNWRGLDQDALPLAV